MPEAKRQNCRMPLSTGYLCLTLALTVCLLAGCMVFSTNKAGDTDALGQDSPSKAPKSESAKVIRDPSKEAIPSQAVIQQSPGNIASRSSPDIGKPTETAVSGAGKTIAKVAQDQKPPRGSGLKAPSSATRKTLQDRVSEFLASLEKATYAFNPPSTLMVSKPTTIHLLLEPKGDASSLTARIKELAPQNASRVVLGETKWASAMEASLSSSDFDIQPTTPARKTLTPSERATWSWIVTPKHPGEKLPLTLTTKAFLPGDFPPPNEIILLQREIDVRVSKWWSFYHYFDKLWKWLLVGLACIAIGLFGWRWKERNTAEKNTAERRTAEKSTAESSPVEKITVESGTAEKIITEKSTAPDPAPKRPPRKRSPRKRPATLPKR